MFDFVEAVKHRDGRNRHVACAYGAVRSLPTFPIPKSVLQELQAIIPGGTKLPVQPIVISGQELFFKIESRQGYPSSRKKFSRYDTPDQLMDDIDERVIRFAEMKAQQSCLNGLPRNSCC